MRDRPIFWKALLLVATSVLLASSACPQGGGGSRQNIVLVTIESLRADRLTGPVPAPDPFARIRALADQEAIRPVLASSTETLPSLASMFTGVSPARHATLVEGIDRLPADLPTLASRLATAGYRTAGFPSLASLGLASGLSRGFQVYGWPTPDLISQGDMAETDRSGWMADAGRRPGQSTVEDALKWVRRHRAEPIFLWIQLAEATPPYATDRALVAGYKGSMYDAAMAYEDRCFKTLFDGFAELGLSERTIFVVAGDHGESLGEQGESFHGLNLNAAALETAAVIIHPKGSRNPKTPPASQLGRLSDLFPAILAMGGVTPEHGGQAEQMMPAISNENGLFAVTLGPRSAFGWNGRIAQSDGQWIWSGPSDEAVWKLGPEPGKGDGAPADATRTGTLRDRALQEAAPIAKRLSGRPVLPTVENRAKVLDLMRKAVAAREGQNREGEVGALKQAWRLDPGNFEVARWLAQANGARAVAENTSLLHEVESLGGGLQEAALTAAQIMSVTPSIGNSFDALKQACSGGGDACAVDLALRLGRAGKYEEAAKELAPVAEKGNDADLWRTLGDLYFAVENTYRAQQSYEKALGLRAGDPDVLLRQGDCLVALRDFKGAAAKYEAARTVAPDLPLVEMRLGTMARQQGDRGAAVEHFRKGLGVDPNSASGALALGRVLSQQGLNEEAIKLFHDAAARDTSSADPYYYASEALAAEGRLDEAEKDLRSALERDPSYSAAIYQLARILVYRGDRVGGGQMLENLAKHPTTEIAVAALRDPLFTNDAPGSPLEKGLQALYAVVQAAVPGGGAILVPESPEPAPTGGTPSPAKP